MITGAACNRGFCHGLSSADLTKVKGTVRIGYLVGMKDKVNFKNNRSEKNIAFIARGLV